MLFKSKKRAMKVESAIALEAGFVVSRQAFSNLLKKLEENEIVRRKVIESRPPRVEYSLAEGLNSLFDRMVEVARIKHGNRQTIDTLINEEALLLAKYLRNELKDWNPRIPSL
jgi:DNA-binding HxlR family transcriptional regulator